MALFSQLPFNKPLLFTSRIARIYLPKKHFRTKVRQREGMKLAPGIKFETPRETNMLFGFVKSCAFTAAFGSLAYCGACIWQYENRKYLHLRNLTPSWVRRRVEPHFKEFEIRRHFNGWWNSLVDGEKAYWGIACLNIIVFCAWKYSPLKPFMISYFCSSPASKAVCLPLIFSSFSHFNFMHIAMNMMALYGFSKSVGCDMGKEQFLGFYLSASVFSGLISNGIKIATGTIGPSLGASGAIMAVLGYFCITNPHARISLMFLPIQDFSASSLLKFIVALDTAGILLRWRLFDHAAHLGGTSFGILYAYFGYKYLWQNRHIVIKKWKEYTE